MAGRPSPRTKFSLWKAKVLTLATRLVREAEAAGNEELKEELEKLIRYTWRARRRDVTVVVYSIWRIYGKWGSKYRWLSELLDAVPTHEEINQFSREPVVGKEE